jgi:hypothetical protein
MRRPAPLKSVMSGEQAQEERAGLLGDDGEAAEEPARDVFEVEARRVR